MKINTMLLVSRRKKEIANSLINEYGTNGAIDFLIDGIRIEHERYKKTINLLITVCTASVLISLFCGLRLYLGEANYFS